MNFHFSRKQAFAAIRLGDLSRPGFTLQELLVAILILGFLSSIAINYSISLLRNQQASALANGFAAWLEELRNIASNNVDFNPNAQVEGGCSVVFESALSNLKNGSLVASTSSDRCKLLIDGNTLIPGSQYNIDISSSSPSFDMAIDQLGSDGSLASFPSSGFVFTPRGAWVSYSGSNLITGDMIVKLFLLPRGPLKCIKLSETLGSISVGTNYSATSVGNSCSASSYALF